MAVDFANIFAHLPIETNQHIASFIETDLDICRFRRVCRATHDAVDADNLTFWRRRFLACFEKPNERVYDSNLKYKRGYQSRKKLLKDGVVFKYGEGGREIACLEVLRDLMAESFSGKNENGVATSTYESSNMTFIERFLEANNLLKIIFRRPPPARGNKHLALAKRSKPTQLLLTIQVLCAPFLLSLDSKLGMDQYGFPDSQMAVYSTIKDNPILVGFHGLDVNQEFVLHNINFWKSHMLRPDEQTLYHSYSELEDDERPRWWSSQPRQGAAKLGRHWKGTYAYVERPAIEAVRQGRGQVEQIQDIFAGEESYFSFQDMELKLVEADQLAWPALFERHLQSLVTPALPRVQTRAQQRSAVPDADPGPAAPSSQFSGEGYDSIETFFASGWLNPLPPQQGVPGWHRMTMMKYFEEDDGSIDADALWAYEGVVLPGAQIMIGRWWSPSDGTGDDMYSGPFILWCIDESRYAKTGCRQ